jgi:hypothetical protein
MQHEEKGASMKLKWLWGMRREKKGTGIRLKEVKAAGRITLDLGIRAYRETGLRPVFDSWGDGKETGCALKAVSVACAQGCSHGFDEMVYSEELKWYFDFRRPDGYAQGFIVGFDGRAGITDAPRYLQGEADGQALRNFIRAGGLENLDAALENIRSEELAAA